MKNSYYCFFFKHIMITILNNFKYFQKYVSISYVYPSTKLIFKLSINFLSNKNKFTSTKYLLNEAVNNVSYYQLIKNNFLPISKIEIQN